METPAPQITQLLRAWSEGDESALGELIPLIYDELHRIAQRYMNRERLTIRYERRRCSTRPICA